MGSIFERVKDADFIELAALCGFASMASSLLDEYRTHVKAHKAGTPGVGAVAKLEQRWYDSLASSPDYSVYSDPLYLCDIWLCWLLYSRRGLQALVNPTSLITTSVAQYISPVRSVVDLGNGFGYTTAALREIFPDAEVVGTNRRDSFQYGVAEAVGKERGFTLCDATAKLGKADVVFASEYFEHVTRPIEHLLEVLGITRARCLIVANGFTGQSIGHFHHYTDKGAVHTAAQMPRIFSNAMKALGYKRLKTKIWNDRPTVWVRIASGV